MIETLNCVEYECVTADCWTSLKRLVILYISISVYKPEYRLLYSKYYVSIISSVIIL